jgi:uncharacterized protein
MIDEQDFKPVTLADRDMFVRQYSRFPPPHSEHLFTSLVSWSAHTPTHYLLEEGELILMQTKDGLPQFWPPIGEGKDEVMTDVLRLAGKGAGPHPVIGVDEKAKERIERLVPGIAITADRDCFDYVYLADDLASLKGKGYTQHRNHLNRFRKSYEYKIERLCTANIEEVGSFLGRWCRQHGCDVEPMLQAEREAIMFCMAHFFELGLSGIAFRIDGQIQALSVYEPMDKTTAVVHFEKAMPEYEGIYQAINNEAAKILAGDFRFINRESDMGIDGLRQAKQRLHPHHMIGLYYIARENLQDAPGPLD